MEKLPIIDLAPLRHGDAKAKKETADQIFQACHDLGFFYGRNHGIEPRLITIGFEQAHHFFNQPDNMKLPLKVTEESMWRGYEPPNEKDSKEAYVFGVERGPDDPLVRSSVPFHGPNPWPGGIPGWREDLYKLFMEMLHLTQLLNRGLSLAVNLQETYLDGLCKDPMAAMRLLRYAPTEDIPGIAPHTDWGAFSVLFQDEVPGLEILRQDTNEWMIVDPVPDTCVINIGEMVNRWTNGYLPATLHRVINRTDKNRHSIACFLDMDYDAMIEVLPGLGIPGHAPAFAPIPAGVFIREQHDKDYSV